MDDYDYLRRLAEEVLEEVKLLRDDVRSSRLVQESTRISLDSLRVVLESQRAVLNRPESLEKIKCVRCGIYMWPKNMKRHLVKCSLKTFDISHPPVLAQVATVVDINQPCSSKDVPPSDESKTVEVDEECSPPRKKRGRPPNKGNI